MDVIDGFKSATRILNSNYFIDYNGIVYPNFNHSGRAKQPIRVISQHIRNGYPSVRINIDGTKIKHHTVHRLMASTLLEPIKGYDQVNHKDGVRTNNHISNLEWSNQSLNTQHAYDTGLLVAKGNRRGFCGDLSKSSIAVIEYDRYGALIRRHESLTATKLLGYHPASVSKNCKGKTASYRDRVFKFETENDKPKRELSEVFI